MLPNPFSEEDAQHYIAEFKSWPYSCQADQLVYAGFRSAATAQHPLSIQRYGCMLNLQYVQFEGRNPLQTHLQHKPDCPIALAIQQRCLEIEEEVKQTKEEIKRTTLLSSPSRARFTAETHRLGFRNRNLSHPSKSHILLRRRKPNFFTSTATKAKRRNPAHGASTVSLPKACCYVTHRLGSITQQTPNYSKQLWQSWEKEVS